jgi:hypothetical protein
MRAVLEIGNQDLNIHLVEIINSLFQQDVTEIVIRKSGIKLEEFDQNNKIQEIISSLREHGHNELLLNEIETGLKSSSIYSKP